ncbi:putative glucose-6-phosphate 1-epimerase [Lytechinus variegatus]|uniref:putative glucose-6-phosphate 1-epimerase n=1 Tax=Lytechinus variegatus TaxID=7654 RepID=UPI001BB15B1F|nr:putative glucose-6-phosphate 1-epimerase [Lytechinus variegatus]
MLQNHFLVDDVTNTSVLGLQEADSSDEINYSFTTSECGERVSIDGPHNSVYSNTSSEHVLKNTQDSASLFIRKWNLPDTVIWNPWEGTNQGSHDVTSDEYKEMICVGCGHVTQPLTLLPGAIFQASQTLTTE